MDQRSGDGLFSGRIKIFAFNCGQEITECRNLGREDRLGFEQDHPELPLQEEGQSRGTESSER